MRRNTPRIEIDIPNPKPDELRNAKPSRIEQFYHRAIAQSLWRRFIGRIQKRIDFALRQIHWVVLQILWHIDVFTRICLDYPIAH